MEIGQVVDFVEEYNNIHKVEYEPDDQQKETRRKASQADWNWLLG